MGCEGHKMVLPFDSDSREFTRGVEVGMLYERAQREPWLRCVIHATNAEMALRLAEALHMALQTEDLDDDWIEATFMAQPEWEPCER